MQNTTRAIAVFSFLLTCCLALDAAAQSAGAAPAAGTELRLFAVEITVGPAWDDSKAPGDQAFFKEHSANLKRLRTAGHIVMGARYSDKGLVVFSARSADEVRAHMEQDPSMAAGTFKYEIHPFNVFYPGLVKSGSAQ